MALTLAVLGPVNVRFAQAQVALPAKAQALLVLLALEQRPMRRELLADMFWGETGERGARANLRLALSRLRQELPGLISADLQSVSLQTELVGEVDALSLLRAATLTPRPPAAALQDAIAAYRGTFLQDFVLHDCPEFEDWVAAQRQRIDRHAVVLLRELVQAARARGDVIAERHSLELWTEIEPWNEDAVAPLVQLLSAQGAQALALDRLAACRQSLAEVCGTRPSDALVALEATAQRPPSSGLASLHAQRDTSPVALASTDAAPLVHDVAGGLFGRSRDLNLVREKILQGERLVMLLGPAGVGKTRLARAVAQDAAASYPHGVVTCSFDHMDPGADPDASQNHFIATLGTTLGLDLSQTVQPLALLCDHLSTLRAILCLDGLEACEAAAPMVARVLDAAPGCLLLVTSRTWLPLMVGWAHELKGLDSEVGPMAQAPAVGLLLACAQAAGALLDATGDQAQLVRLTRLLDGSPLAIQFAAQSLCLYSPRQLADRLVAGAWPQASHELPGYRHRSLDEVMAQVRAQMTPDLQRAWARCALFKGSFTLAWARECAGVTESQLADLRDRFVLAREPQERLRMHELTRQYGLCVLDGMAEADDDRLRFARAALARLVQLLPALRDVDFAVVELLKPEVSTLASAFEMALQSEAPEDIHAAVEALSRAYHRLGWQYAALTVLESALERHRGADPVWLIPWHRMAGEAARSLYGYQRADVHFKKSVQLGGTALARGRWKPWLVGASACLKALAARPCATAAQRNAQRMLAHSISEMLRPRYLNGSPLPELLSGVAQAWLAARRSASTDARLTVMLRLLRFLPTDVPAVFTARLMKGIRETLPQVDPVHAAYATLETGLILVNYGVWAEAESYLRRASHSLAALGDGYHSLECLCELHVAQMHAGDFARATHEVDDTINRARQMNQPSVLRWMLLTRLQLWLRTGGGSAQELSACMGEVHSIPTFKSPVEELSVRGHESMLACRNSQTEGVLAHATAVLQIARRMGAGRIHVLVTMALTLDATMFLCFAPDADPRLCSVAQALADQFGVISRNMGIFGPRRLLYRGQAAALAGRGAAALRAWQAGLALARGRTLDYDLARLNWMLSLYLDGEAGARHRAAAHELFARCAVRSPYPFVPAAPG